MRGAVPDNEENRLKELARLRLADGTREEVFDCRRWGGETQRFAGSVTFCGSECGALPFAGKLQ